MTRRYQPTPRRPSIPDFPLDPNDSRPVHVEVIYQPRPNPWLSPAESPARASDAAPNSSAPQILPGETAALSRALEALAESGDAEDNERRSARPRRSAPSASRMGARDRRVTNHHSSSHHSRHCTICRHPEREAIEEDFVHWHPPRHIASDYKITTRALNRHAHAAGLFSLRDRKLRFALGHIVERAMDVTPTADSIIRAVHAYTRVNNSGQWIEPPAHVIVSSGAALRNDRAVPDSSRPAFEPPASGIELPALPLTACRVENDPTR
jgi:hypothetical protein